MTLMASEQVGLQLSAIVRRITAGPFLGGRLIQHHLFAGTYAQWYQGHLDTSTYRPLIDKALELSRRASSRSQG
jgi:hypothetical protein